MLYQTREGGKRWDGVRGTNKQREERALEKPAEKRESQGMCLQLLRQGRRGENGFLCWQIGAGWSVGGVGWDGSELQGGFYLQGGGTAPGWMEALIKLFLSLQSEFRDFPPLPSGTGKLPVHPTAVFGSGARFAGRQREAKAWEQRQQHPGLPCSQGSMSGHLALLSGHSSHPCLPSLLQLQGCVPRSSSPKGHSWSGHCQQGHRQERLPRAHRASRWPEQPRARCPCRTASLSCANTNLVQRLPTPALPSDYKCTRSF